MKIFFLEHDTLVQDDVIQHLDNCRLKVHVKKIQDEQAIFDEDVATLNTYKLFVLNLKNPTDPKIINFIRESGSIAPILLILEKDQDPKSFKPIYYLSYDHIIVKDFSPEEIVFSIYKLCGVWNNDIFFLDDYIYYDCRNSMFINKEEKILFGKKEAMLLKYLFLKSPSSLTCNEIISIVYENKVTSPESIRALVKQVRNKLPFKLIKTIKGEGYQILPTISTKKLKSNHKIKKEK